MNEFEKICNLLSKGEGIAAREIFENAVKRLERLGERTYPLDPEQFHIGDEVTIRARITFLASPSIPHPVQVKIGDGLQSHSICVPYDNIVSLTSREFKPGDLIEWRDGTVFQFVGAHNGKAAIWREDGDLWAIAPTNELRFAEKKSTP